MLGLGLSASLVPAGEQHTACGASFLFTAWEIPPRAAGGSLAVPPQHLKHIFDTLRE